MDTGFVYWDNFNLFHEAQRLAVEHHEDPNAHYPAHQLREHAMTSYDRRTPTVPSKGSSPRAPFRPNCGTCGTASVNSRQPVNPLTSTSSIAHQL